MVRDSIAVPPSRAKHPRPKTADLSGSGLMRPSHGVKTVASPSPSVHPSPAELIGCRCVVGLTGYGCFLASYPDCRGSPQATFRGGAGVSPFTVVVVGCVSAPEKEQSTATLIGNSRLPPDPAVHRGRPERRVCADSARSLTPDRTAGVDPLQT